MDALNERDNKRRPRDSFALTAMWKSRYDVDGDGDHKLNHRRSFCCFDAKVA